MIKHNRRQAFTLIEMLVVVAIVAILATLLFPALTSALKKGKKTRVQTEVKAIETAINAYYADYGKFPLDNGLGDVTYGKGSKDNADIIKGLRGLDQKINPRNINYLQVSNDSVDENGNLVNPDGIQYMIAVNTDFDNVVTSDAGISATGRNVAVWTDYEDERIKSW